MTTPTETIAVPESGTLLGARVREAGWGYAFVLLPMAVFGIFFIYPLGYAIYISFYEWGILGKVGRVGCQNYRTSSTTRSFAERSEHGRVHGRRRAARDGARPARSRS